jgi:hypothetical protein
MSRFEALDKNSDGVLTGEEFDELNTVVKDADRNKDGKIRSVAYQAACAKLEFRHRRMRPIGAANQSQLT